MKRINLRLHNGLALVVAMFLANGPTSVKAGGLRDVVSDLYSGDGIVLSTEEAFPGDPRIFHEAHFTTPSLEGLEDLNNAVTASVGNLPFNSTVSGYTYDVEKGVPVRSTESLGPLLAERANTIGRGILNVAFSYIRIDFDRFNGERLDDLKLRFPHTDCCGANGRPPPDGILGVPAFENDVIDVDVDLEIQQDVFAFLATFGLTDRWDVGALIPIINIEARAKATARIVDMGGGRLHSFEDAPDMPVSETGGEETGIGDIILRTKYNFIRNHLTWPDMAVVGDITLPTGDEDDLLGTGDAKFRFLFVASRRFNWLTPHVNLGYEVTTGSTENDNFRYVAGFDARVLSQLTTAVDVIGKWNPDGPGEQNNLLDIALQAKWNPFGTTSFNTFVLLPINRDDGLRSDAIWSVGIEHTFF